MVWPVDYDSIFLSLNEATVCAGHEVLAELDDNHALIDGDPQGILGLAPPALPNPLFDYYYFCINYI